MLTWSTKMWIVKPMYSMYIPMYAKLPLPPFDALRVFLFDFLCLKAMHYRIH
jgi:hypothetical protein